MTNTLQMRNKTANVVCVSERESGVDENKILISLYWKDYHDNTTKERQQNDIEEFRFFCVFFFRPLASRGICTHDTKKDT